MIKKNLNEKSKNILTIIVASFILLLIIGFNIYNNYVKIKGEFEASNKTTIVKDNSRYYTVLNCCKKFINTIQSNSTDDILLLLQDEYKTTYTINSQNVKNFIPKLENGLIYDYEGETMYQKRISKNVVEYYVNGKININTMDDSKLYTQYNMTVIMYEDSLTFSIKPGIGDLT